MRKPRVSHRWVTVIATLALLLTGTGFDLPQSTYRANREGKHALEEGDPARAHEHFERALELSPDDPRLLYNLGVALAKEGDLERAEELWSDVAGRAEGELARDAWFNRGIAALEQNEPEKAVGAFSESLLVDPDDLEARQNLDRALRMLSRQPPPQSSPSGQQQDQEQEQEQDGQQQQQQQGDQQQEQQQHEQNRQQGEESPEDQKQQNEPQEEQQGQQQDQKQERQPEPQQSSSPARDDAGEEPDENLEMARRLLEQVGREEFESLRRALAERVEKDGSKSRTTGGKDW